MTISIQTGGGMRLLRAGKLMQREASMKTTTSLLALIISGGLMINPALAADLGSTKDTPGAFAAPANINWTGFYVGAHIGYGNANHQIDVEDTCCEFNVLSLGGLNSHGAIAGVDLGADIRRGRVVLGFLGSYDWSSMETTLSAFDGYFSAKLEKDYEWSIGGRGGILVDERNLAYILVAYTGTEYTLKSGDFEQSQDYQGVTVGAGWEHAFGDGWFGKAQYTHTFYGKEDWANEDCLKISDGLDEDKVTIGLNYKFGIGKTELE